MNLKNFSQKIELNISLVITTTINLKHTCLQQIPLLKKDASINDEIDQLRHSATSSLFERDDVIIIASVSCIYGLGNPEEYKNLVVSVRVGMEMERSELLRKLVDVQYSRNDIDFQRGTFRVRGDVVEIFPASREKCVFA